MIDADLSMQEFEEIAKRAYVAVASRRAARGNGTVNRSRVAAITGLSRAEVKTLFAPAKPAATKLQKSRAARVVDGWTTDPRFSTRAGSARVLQLRDGPKSFSQLVRLYAGDIPPRAILDRLQRLGLVTVTPSRAKSGSNVQLVRKTPANALGPMVEPIIEHMTNALSAAKENSLTAISTVQLPAPDAPTLAAITRAAIERRDVFLSGLVSSFPVSSDRQPSLEILVSISPRGTAHDQSPPAPTRGGYRKAKRRSSR